MSPSAHPNSSSVDVVLATGPDHAPVSGTIPRLLDLSANEFANRPALVWRPDHSLHYESWHQLVAEGTKQLTRLGVRRQDRVAAVLPSSMDTCLAFLSVSSCAVFCPLNPDYTDREFELFLNAIEAGYLITRDHRPTPARAVAERLGIRIIQLTGDVTRGLKFDGETGSVGSPVGDAASPADTALILHTSGTTSAPKIVPLTHANLTASASNMAASLSLTADDCCLNILPPFHIGALVDLLLAPLSSGGVVVIGDGPEPESVFEHLLEFQPTWCQGVPTMLHGWLRHRSETADRYLSDGTNRRLRLIRSVSAPLPDKWLAELEQRFNVPVIEIYGMTETSGLICSNPLDERRPGSVGKPVGQKVAIVDGEGNPASSGASGEIGVNGTNVFSGYQTSEDTVTTGGRAFVGSWFRTGDEGRLDEDGYLFVTGRIKEIINRGGEKFSPLEVDRVALGHPDVREAASFCVRHDLLGEEIAMAVIPETGAFDVKSLRNYLSDNLAYYKVPRTIHVVESLPRNRSGKILRHELSAKYCDSDPGSIDQEWIPPTNDLAREIARIWCGALNVKRVGMGDDFFDLGGDSLSARGMFAELKKRFDGEIQVAALFDNPTLGEFKSYLAERIAEYRSASGEPKPENSGGLPDAVFQQLKAYLSAWRGRRRRANSLLVGLNTIGDRPPLFWCGQGFDELKRLSDALGDNQPVYGMRSMLQIDGRDGHHNELLAGLYAEEIVTLQPERDVFIGGFCEGGNIAFAVAEELQQRRRGTALLCLHDQFVPRLFSGRVAFFFGRPDKDNPYGHFQEPEKGWHQFYKGRISLNRSDMGHSYTDPRLVELGRRMLYEMDRAIANEPSNKTIRLEKIASMELPDTAYRAGVSVGAELPALMNPGESLTLQVRVRNLSPDTWPPSRISGIVLSSRWFNRNGAPRSLFDGRSTFDEPVLPGESITLSLTVTAPKKPGARVLVIDLADEGVAWFQDRGGEPLRVSLRVFRGAKYMAWIFMKLRGQSRPNHA